MGIAAGEPMAATKLPIDARLIRAMKPEAADSGIYRFGFEIRIPPLVSP